MDRIGEIVQTAGSNELMPNSKHSAELMPLTEAETRRKRIRRQLVAFSIMRGEEMGDVALLAYSKAIAEECTDDEDITAVLGTLSKRKLDEYEKAIPRLGDLLDMISRARLQRIKAKREAERLQKEEDERKHREEHPEEYVSVADFWKEVTERIAARAKPDPETVKAERLARRKAELEEGWFGKKAEPDGEA